MEQRTKWRVGDVEISRIPEFEMAMFAPLFIYPDLAPERLEQHRAWLEPRHLDPETGKLIIVVQAYVVKTRTHTILVDACGGNDKNRPSRAHFHQQKRPWLERLAAAGYKPEDIDVVLCTHLHIDHVGWNTRLLNGRWVPTFPRARYLISRPEWDHWQDESARAAYAADDHIGDSVLPLIEAGQCDFVAMNHVVNDEAWLEPTPGHTPGHVALRVRSGGVEAAVSGDLMHTAVQCAEPQISSCFCVDKGLSATTRRAFLEGCAERNSLVLPAHFPSPSAGHVEPAGGGFRFRFAE